jgi:ribosomal subunit interface protein
MAVLAAGSSAISWNIVERNLTLDSRVKDKLTRKVATLAKYLAHFPPETLHLQVVLEKLAKKETYQVSLTLRVPSHILHAEKSSPDLIGAVDDAVDAMIREIKSFKAELRRDYRWKRPLYRARLRADRTLFFAEPMQPGAGPQTRADVIRELLQSHEEQLLAHARRQVRMAELAGDIVPGSVDPRALVDEVARICLTDPGKKPAELTYELWFYRLLGEELARRCEKFREDLRLRAEPVAVESRELDEAEGYDAELPLDLVTRELEPEETLPEEQIPDEAGLPPDRAAARDDLIDALQRTIKHWPRDERDIFELHFFAGFDATEIAMIKHRNKDEVEALIEKLQQRVRDLLRETG